MANMNKKHGDQYRDYFQSTIDQTEYNISNLVMVSVPTATLNVVVLHAVADVVVE